MAGVYILVDPRLNRKRNMARKVVTVYTKPACPQCTATTRWLKEHDIEFQEESAVDNVDAIKSLLGIQQAPVTKVLHDTGVQVLWSGFNPDALKAQFADAA